MPIRKSPTYKATSLATYIMIVLILVGISATLSGVTIHSRSTKILENLYEQEDIWELFAKTALNDTVFVNPDFAKMYTIRRLERMTELLAKSRDMYQQLKVLVDQDSWLSFLSHDKRALPILQQEQQLLITQDSMNSLLTDAKGFVHAKPEFANGSLAFVLSSGMIPTIIEDSIDLARDHAKSDIQTLYGITLGVGVLTIFGMLFIRKYIIVPAMSSMAKNHSLEIQYEKEIHEQKLLTNSAFLSLTDIAVVFDKDGQFVVANDAFTKLNDAVGHSADPLAVFEEIANKLHPSKPAQQHDISTLATLITSVEHVEMDNRLINWVSNSIEGNYWSFVGRDQTELVAKQALTIHNEQLESIGRVASGIAHDFNNILGGIILRAETALLADKSEPSTRAIYQSFLESSLRGKAMISQLLSYSRKQTLFPQSVSAKNIKRAIVSQIHTPEGIELLISDTPDLDVNIDVNYLTTAVENIVRNACFSIGNTPGRISIFFEKLTDSAGQKSLKIGIIDTGKGFSQDALKSATEPFYTTKSEHLGVGLGLAMVAGFVAQSQGKLNITNKDIGAEVTLIFPAIDSDLFRKTPATESGEEHTNTPTEVSEEHIYLLEDDPQLGELHATFLSPYCDSFTLATSIDQCYEHINNNRRITTALFDWNLTDGTSKKLIFAFRSHYPNAKIVLTSGNINNEMTQTANACNAVLMAKPYRLNELLKVIGLH